MTSALWAGTNMEAVSAMVWTDARLRAAFHMGQVEQAVFDSFGVTADDPAVPDEAREFALILLDAMWGRRDLETATRRMAELVQRWNARKAVN